MSNAAVPAAVDEPVLPPVRVQGALSLEAALAQRRSQRHFASRPLTAAQAGQLLWAAQGVSDAQGHRTAPSAGATYPLVLYLVAGRVDGMTAGVYRYVPQGHRLVPAAVGDRRGAVAEAVRGQSWLVDAPALVIVAAEPGRTAARYGARAERYTVFEAGAATQNLLLQAAALGAGATVVGAFDEATLRHGISLPAAETPLAVIAVGFRR